MNTKEMRADIVVTVQQICQQHKIDYRQFWNQLFREYHKINHINPHELYTNDFKNRSKLDMLELYENLYGTMTKLYELTNELKN